jgi:aspartyl-tRNA synthetase
MTSFQKRSVTCGQLRASDAGRSVVVNGWIDVVRDFGNLVFLDVRDRFGVTQVVCDPAVCPPEVVTVAQTLRSEWVVAIGGEVRGRDAAAVNRERETGEIEIVARSIAVLNPAKTPPFEISDHGQVSEELRFRYRYLDLRRPSLREALELRHRFLLALRHALDDERYLEIETPMLTRMTPEGSREYVVPSRIHPGRFYALPQSPQVFKQLLMVGGMDRYFQIARCLRDEDLRADRQPEFTQLDLELSFGDEEDVHAVIEKVLARSIREVFGRELAVPFPRLTWQEAADRYGLDKPDLRFGLEIHDLGECLKGCGFQVVDSVLDKGGAVRGICVPGGAATVSRKTIDELAVHLQGFGAKGLAFLKTDDQGQLAGPLAKFVDAARRERLVTASGFQPGDLLLVVADALPVVRRSLGELRNELARRLDLIPKDGRLAFCWITSFPMFEWEADEARWKGAHHPFTTPLEDYPGHLEKDPGTVKARAYDLVLNGWELGSGSVRIHQRPLQQRVFECLGIGEEEASAKFGFFLEAFEFGAPPHAGIALGIERTLALVTGRSHIRDFYAFPKTASASDLMNGAPSEIPPRQLAELHLRIAPPPAS